MGQPNAPGRQYAAGADDASAELATAGYNVQLDRMTHAIDDNAAFKLLESLPEDVANLRFPNLRYRYLVKVMFSKTFAYRRHVPKSRPVT